VPPRTTVLNRLRKFVARRTILSHGELEAHGIHHQIVRRALDRGLLTKIDRGWYLTSTDRSSFERRVLLACKRVPHGVVCLESALRFHGVLDSNSDVISMAIDRKARKPVVKGLRLHFVRFSGDALTQGVVNTRIDGIPVRVYSVAKTVADCFKYRNKIGVETAVRSFRESLCQRKCSWERVQHFARICRVSRILNSRLYNELNAHL
jgi:predicted transcriptional regulator of viral defense system